MRRITGLVIVAAVSSLTTQATSGVTSLARSGAEFVEDARYTVGAYPCRLFAADLDGDRDLDIVSANLLGGSITVLLNNGEGTYPSSKNYSVQLPSGVSGADLDKDGDVDLMVTNMQTDQVALFINQGDGTFKAQGTYPVGPNPTCLALIDLDGDKDADCVAGWGRRYYDGGLSVLMSNGSGAFPAGDSYVASRRVAAIYAGDLDGDLDMDIVTANSDDYFQLHTDSISVFLNKGDGALSQPVSYPLGGDPRSVAGGDLNGDGYADLVADSKVIFGVGGTDRIAVFLNKGDGTFSPGTGYDAPASCCYVAMADFDRDGDLDIATANGTSNSISLFANNGDGTLSDRVDQPVNDHPVKGNPEALCTGDFDRDGDTDLAVALSVANRVAILLNGGRQAMPVRNLELSVLSLDLGEVLLGQSADTTLTAFSTGENALTITSIATKTGAFAVTPSAATLEPGTSMQIHVRYTAANEGVEADTLRIASDDPDSPIVALPLSGRGVEPIPKPRLNLNVPGVDFDGVLVGEAADTMLTISNLGDAVLSVYDLATGTDRFTVSVVSFDLQPGEYQEVRLTFSPTSAQMSLDTLTIRSNDPRTPILVLPLAGRGRLPELEPRIVVSEGSLAFGGVMVGQSRGQSLTVSNPGTGVLIVGRLWASEDVFVVSDGSLAIDPGGSHELTVTFTPASEGFVAATLAMQCDDPDTLVEVSLSGKGTPGPKPLMHLSPSRLDFGEVRIGEQAERSFQVANLGSSVLQVNSITADHPEFEVIPTSLAVSPGEREFVVVTFTPTRGDSASASLAIESNDPLTPAWVMRMWGRGVAEPRLSVSTPDVEFEYAPVGTLLTSTVTLSNTGSAALVVDTLTTSDPAFGIGAASYPLVLQPGQSVDVVITFSLRTEGTLEGVLTIVMGPQQATLRLSGTARPLFRAVPNPFSSETTLHLVLPAEASAEINIYNVLGQRVRTLTGNPSGGSQTLGWDGRDDGNLVVASGVYVCEMKVIGEELRREETVRVMRL